MTLVGISHPSRTDCPGNEILTIEQLIQLPCVLIGSPQVIADATSLKRHIGWAHVLENLNPCSYLRGHELVLTTGIGWGPDADFSRFVGDLVTLQCAGLMLELGVLCPVVPTELIQACKDHNFPLIVLHEPVAFVEITETLHQILLSTQTRRIAAAGEVTEHFTRMMQYGSPAETILEDCARMLGCPVILEDSGFNLMNYASAVELPGDYFDHWQDRSRAMHVVEKPECHVVPVQIHGKRFGSLIAPNVASHSAGAEHVLTMAAIALGTELLRKRGPALWKFDTACELLDDLVNHRETDMHFLERKFEATGFPVRNRILRGFALALTAPIDPQAAARELERRLGASTSVIIGALHSPSPKLFGVFSTKTLQLQEALPQTMLKAGSSQFFGGTLYVGQLVSEFSELLGSITQAIDGCELQLDSNKLFVTADKYPLALLTHQLRYEPAMQRLPQQVLASILALEPIRRDECLRVLEAYLASPTNRSQAATRCRLSRSVFYQRLALLETLLELDLNDARALTVLTLGLTVYRQSQLR